MFAKFKINIEDVRKINASSALGIGRNLYSSILTDSCSDVLRQLLENEQGIIDGEKLKREYFPTKDKREFNVFISHSHSDIKEIEKFATTLEEKYGVRCFVDSMIWKDIADLQYNIDSKYSRGTNGKLDYKAVQQSTAHIHSLLSIALFEMIDQCECCIFVQSNKSLALDLKDTATLSPWIYEEIFYMNHARKILPKRIPERKLFSDLNESRITDARIKMSHVVDLSEFKDLMYALPTNYLQGDKFLNHIYWQSNLIEQISTMWD